MSDSTIMEISKISILLTMLVFIIPGAMIFNLLIKPKIG